MSLEKWKNVFALVASIMTAIVAIPKVNRFLGKLWANLRAKLWAAREEQVDAVSKAEALERFFKQADRIVFWMRLVVMVSSLTMLVWYMSWGV